MGWPTGSPPKGDRAWYLVRRIDKRAERVRLGGHDITIEQARDLAAKLNGEISNGRNPARERRTARQSSTLEELWQSYKAKHLEPGASHRTVVSDESRWKTCFEDWKTRRALSIVESEVRSLHAKPHEVRQDEGANPGHPYQKDFKATFSHTQALATALAGVRNIVSPLGFACAAASRSTTRCDGLASYHLQSDVEAFMVTTYRFTKDEPMLNPTATYKIDPTTDIIQAPKGPVWQLMLMNRALAASACS